MIRQRLSILIADDHPMIRNGLSSMLGTIQENDNISIDFARNGTEAVNRAMEKDYDIIFMDYQLPQLNGIEATRRIVSAGKKSKILGISNYDELNIIKNMILAGGHGFVMKTIDANELMEAIEALMQGEHYYCKHSQHVLKRSNVTSVTEPGNAKKKYQLSPREVKLLKLLAQDKTTDEIAEALGLSPRTVEGHRMNLLKKLEIKSLAGIGQIALSLGLM